MIVTFGNDETFKPKLRHTFAQGSGSRIIDLPGERRIIKRIDFHYKSINRREGKGIVQVFARWDSLSLLREGDAHLRHLPGSIRLNKM
jgi:hypothetical protein